MNGKNFAGNVEVLRKWFGAAFTKKRHDDWAQLVNRSYRDTVMMNFDEAI